MNVEAENKYREIYNQAIRYLSYREYAIEELRTKLLKKFDSELEVAQVLEQLLSDDLLSEQRFAESYIRARVNKGYGPEHIRSELMQKGLAKWAIDQALKDSEFVWSEEVYKVWVKKFNQAPNDNMQDRVRQWRFLQYRGFSNEHIKMLFSRFD